MSKIELPSDVSSYLRLKEEQNRIPAYHLFSDLRLAVRWSIVYFNWIVITMVYYGLILNVSNLSGNIFLNFFIAVLVEVIGLCFAGMIINRLSRKRFYISSLMLSGGACAAAIVPQLLGSDKLVVVALSMAGKLGISIAFYLLYVYTAELFPTACRGFGMGSSSMMARFGGVASPYVADLNTYFEGQFGAVLPQLVFGGSGLFGGFLVFLLPDTRNRKLPETIADIKSSSKKTTQNLVV